MHADDKGGAPPAPLYRLNLRPPALLVVHATMCTDEVRGILIHVGAVRRPCRSDHPAGVLACIGAEPGETDHQRAHAHDAVAAGQWAEER